MASGKTVVVTGASTGIGEACALRLARDGWQVFAGVRKVADGEALRKQVERITPVILDVTDSRSIAAARDAVGAHGLDGLVNNAGIVVAGPVELVPIDRWRTQFEVNVIGQVAVTQAFLPLLRLARGRIVNMSSIGGISALPLSGPYSASKFALEGLSDSLRMELEPWGISVSLIEPGAVSTPIWDKSLGQAQEQMAGLPKERLDLYSALINRVSRVAMERGKAGIAADEVAKAVEHALVSAKPKARYVVGKDARARTWLMKLPVRTRDRLILKEMAKLK